MPNRKIIAFHQDDHADWVADLDCGHTQHVRHNPPWTIRPWVTIGRASSLPIPSNPPSRSPLR